MAGTESVESTDSLAPGEPGLRKRKSTASSISSIFSSAKGKKGKKDKTAPKWHASQNPLFKYARGTFQSFVAACAARGVRVDQTHSTPKSLSVVALDLRSAKGDGEGEEAVPFHVWGYETVLNFLWPPFNYFRIHFLWIWFLSIFGTWHTHTHTHTRTRARTHARTHATSLNVDCRCRRDSCVCVATWAV